MLPPSAPSREPRAVPQQTTGLEPSHIPGTCSLAHEGEGQGLTGVFLLALPSAATDTERAMSLAGEALPGRRDTGAGSPVRISSATSELCTEQQLRVLFMLEQEERALEAEHKERGRHGASQPRNQVLRQTPAHRAGAASQLDKTAPCKLPRGKQPQAQPWRGSR